MKFSKLSFPLGLNLGVLSEFLSDEDLKALVMKHMEEPRLNRRIILPSARTVKKVIAHYYGIRVEKGLSWDKVMATLKKEQRVEDKFLMDAGLERRHMKSLFLQRKREIKQEKKSGNK